jgi:hypothetical protein
MGRAKIQYKFAEIPQGRLKFRLKYVERFQGRGDQKLDVLNRVLARILDLGRVSNDQGVHMSITLNSQNHGSTELCSPTTDNACGCSMLCNQIQGEHTLILRTDIRILSYFNNSWGYLKPL